MIIYSSGQAKAIDYGFDNIFSGDGNATPSPEQMVHDALKDGKICFVKLEINIFHLYSLVHICIYVHIHTYTQAYTYILAHFHADAHSSSCACTHNNF